MNATFLPEVPDDSTSGAEIRTDGGAFDPGRRRFLRCVPGALTSSAAVAGAVYLDDPFRIDDDGDGIPDALERSPRFNRQVASMFDGSFDGLDPHRKDLLIDIRYIGNTHVSDAAKSFLRDRFRENGIYVQFLDRSKRYDAAEVRERYGSSAEDLLVKRNGFYWSEIEPFLRNVAFQLVVVPDSSWTPEPNRGKVYSRVLDEYGDTNHRGYINGMNVGNRAVVVQRLDWESEAELVFHEIAHLVLCHDADSDNPGTMGTRTEIDLTKREWTRFRNGLTNIRDVTGYDIVLRTCLFEEYPEGSGLRDVT
jgi:hypothetical protein